MNIGYTGWEIIKKPCHCGGCHTAPGPLTVAPGATRDDTPEYGWCTAGFDTTDLREAEALLDELS
jgi:hypothetical protein